MSRTLPASVLMPEYESLLREGAELPLVVSGESMLPFLRPGRDTVFLKRPEGALQEGDIAFFRRATGDYILHRVVRTDENRCWFLGDAQTRVEGPLPVSCVIARVTAVRRGGRLIRPDSLFWQFFSGPWRRLRGRRSPFLKVYHVFYRLEKRRQSQSGV